MLETKPAQLCVGSVPARIDKLRMHFKLIFQNIFWKCFLKTILYFNNFFMSNVIVYCIIKPSLIQVLSEPYFSRNIEKNTSNIMG